MRLRNPDAGGGPEGVKAVRPHVCVHDVNLGQSRTSDPVAELMRDLGRLFLFLTGYAVSGSATISAFTETPCLHKPANLDPLI